MSRPLGLGTRLALAFGGLFLGVSVLTAALAAWRAGESAEELLYDRMASLVQAIPASFVDNPDVLARTKRLVGADVASTTRFGSLGHSDLPALVSSLPADGHRELQALLAAPGFRPEDILSRPKAVSLAGRGYQLLGTWQAGPGAGAEAGSGRRLVLLIVPQEEIDRARSAAVRPIVWTALVGAAAAVALGFLLARTVARPLGRLAADAGRVAGGDRAFIAAPGGGAEVEKLSRSLERMSASLLKAREEIVRSERMAVAGQMAAALAHEVRNPLSSARMIVELLHGDASRPEQAEQLRAVLDELSRLELVVDEMVTFARPTPPVFARIELPAVAEEVLAFMRRQLDHAHVRIRTDFEAAAPAARADRNKVKQVLVNLLLNAIQAQPRGGEVRVRIARAGSGGRVCLEVSDSGPGIRREELDRIFAPFYTTKAGGAGLGLSVSRQIAEEHGGALSCDGGGGSTGRGASFRLELPEWKA